MSELQLLGRAPALLDGCELVQHVTTESNEKALNETQSR